MDDNRTVNENEIKTPEKAPESLLTNIYDMVEILAKVTVFVMLLFAFIIRLNVVSGHSMDHTLYGGEYNPRNGQYTGGEWLAVSDLFYEPTQGDIVIIHKVDASPYDKPIVKRVIATEGQTIDIDFETWTVTVDGKVIDESPYITLEGSGYISTEYTYPLTLGENEIFVMGDNRNVSADSRIIGPIDKRCVVGKAIFRIFPIKSFTVFKNPLNTK